MAKQKLLKWYKPFTWTTIGIRTINFEVAQDLKDYSSNKRHVTIVQLKLAYKQDDFTISEQLWDRAKPDIVNAISNNTDIIDKPIDIPV